MPPIRAEEVPIQPFDSDESFIEELEKAVKGLSVVTDQASADDLRRLVSQLQEDGAKPEEAERPARSRRSRGADRAFETSSAGPIPLEGRRPLR